MIRRAIDKALMSSSFAIAVVDSEGHTALLLKDRIAERGHRPIPCAATREAVSALFEAGRPDAMVMDYHLERPAELELCETAKKIDASLPIIALAAPGEALHRVQSWNASRLCIDQVVRKPLAGEALFSTIEALAARRSADRRAGRYASLLAEDGVRWADSGRVEPAVDEMAVLFTDIRRSTHLISSQPLPEWFGVINRALTEQAQIVMSHQGAVVKFTGDGLIASFRGRGRAHFALRCAVALQELDAHASYRGSVRAGIGLAEGLVMTGPIGAAGRQQYDIIGATVHLAARLCSIANEGEIVATPRLVRAAGFTGSMPPATRTVQLRGFDAPVECVSFMPIPTRSPHSA